MTNLPLIAYTMGDAAGVGPEIIARVLPGLCGHARAVVIGDVKVMRRAAKLVDCKTEVVSIGHPSEATANTISVITPVGAPDVSVVPPSTIDARAGRAANEYLCHAIDLALAGGVDAMARVVAMKLRAPITVSSACSGWRVRFTRCGFSVPKRRE